MNEAINLALGLQTFLLR